MNKVYLEENIFYMEDFLSEESYLTLLDFCNSGDFTFGDPHVKQRGIKYVHPNVDVKYIKAYDEYIKKMKSIFDNEIHSLVPLNHIQTYKKYEPEMGYDKHLAMGPHFDDEGYRKDYNFQDLDEPVIYFGAIYYLNDNYAGGELLYPEKNISVKPKANMLVAHAGPKEYTHAVNQVLGNDRFQIPAFVRNNKCIV